MIPGLCPRRHRNYEAGLKTVFGVSRGRIILYLAFRQKCRFLQMPNKHIHTAFSEVDLVDGLKSRNREAMALLYDRYSRALYGVAFRIVRSEQGAEDVLQEAFVKVWEQIDRFDSVRGTLFTWMHSIVRNLSLDVIKSKAYRNSQENRNLDEVVDTVELQYRVTYNPEIIGLRESVNELEPELAEVVQTLYFKGLTQSEAAEELALPIGTVKTRARRALNRLRGLMGESD